MTQPICLEDYPQTHDGAVDFVQDVFKSMGGTAVPPKRPRNRISSSKVDAFLMDFENACLVDNWNSSVPHPVGPKRHEHKEWAKMIKSQVYPHHSDVDWEDYVEWVENGGGAEWFQIKIKWMKADYSASMMRLGGLVLKHSALLSGALAYSYQTQKHEHLFRGKVLGKSSEVAFPATARSLVVVERINAGRWT